MKYNDIIKLRSGKANYNIEEEKDGEWTSFIPNDQFNGVLHTVLKSVRGNNIDYHKSFWINGTYGTGKSHAVAVISHLLSDPIGEIREWVDYEYKEDKFAALRQSIYKLREEKCLLPIKIYGLGAMSLVSDLALVFQQAVKAELNHRNLNITVPTDFEAIISNIEKNPIVWDSFIENHTELSSIVKDRKKLIANLESQDLDTYHRTMTTLRKADFSANLKNSNVGQWLIEVQNELAKTSKYNGLLILWDEFTDVMTAFGSPVLKKMQGIAEKFANEENNSYICLISHPSAFDKISPEEVKQTDGRYHRMKYNMESVSAFKIMSRKFEVVDEERYREMCNMFYDLNSKLLNIYTENATDALATRTDLFNLFPLHPGTANLATHYATVIGSSSRSVFEFLDQNDAITDFLQSEEIFLNHLTITPDFLWNYVLKVFLDDITNYGAVTERYNSYRSIVDNEGEAYTAIFKGILLLNAFNNMSGGNNNGLVTPSEDNIRALFMGTQYANAIDDVLNWFNENGVIQRAPGGLFSIQYSALPSQEIEDKKAELRNTQFRFTSQVIKFGGADGAASTTFEKKFVQTIIRPYKFDFYSDVDNESSLASQIKNGKKAAKPSDVFMALMIARNNEELAKLRDFACKKSEDETDKDLKDIVFIVFDEVFTDKAYDRFIEYQANYACASSHGFVDQTATHRKHASEMLSEFMTTVQRGNAVIYLNGETYALSVKHLSSELNDKIVPTIFSAAPDAFDLLRKKAPRTFWKPQNSKEIVRKFLFGSTKTELSECIATMAPVKILLQDSVDENLQWKSTIPSGHPLKAVCEFVENKIKFADKTLLFNFTEKFEDLTHPPFGLYNNYAAMAMMAFALRPWINKIFDPMGKPRDANNLVEDISELFKVWDNNKASNKLNFKFQTPEEGKLCKSFISLFHLNNKNNDYSDISSLKDARFAITRIFLEKKGYPLWSVKYAPDTLLCRLPISFSMSDKIRTLIDNIVKICSERDLRNPALITDTLDLITDCKFEVEALLKENEAFESGFNVFLMDEEIVDLKESEIDEAYTYVKQHLESTVGYWTEDEVRVVLKDWRIEKSKDGIPVGSNVVDPNGSNGPSNPGSNPSNPDELAQKRAQAKARIAKITTLEEANYLLEQLCNTNSLWLLDQIIANGKI